MTAARRDADLVRRVHIDTDPGLDDLLALALAFASPELRVESISTVAGNAAIGAVSENAQRFLALTGNAIPLGRGAEGPLALSPVDAEAYHGPDGRRGVPIPAVDRRPLPSALEVMHHSLDARLVDQIVALGPLTNLATLLAHDERLFEGVEIVWMGGTLGAGNVTAVAEFNCYSDPAAAERILGSGLPVRVIGLDVTRSVRLQAQELDARPLGSSELGRFLAAVLDAMMEAEEPVAGHRQATLHDPSALLAACMEDLFRYEPKRLRVRVEEGHERGRLVEVPLDAPGGAQALPPHLPGIVRYAVEANTQELTRLFLERLAAWCGGTDA